MSKNIPAWAMMILNTPMSVLGKKWMYDTLWKLAEELQDQVVATPAPDAPREARREQGGAELIAQERQRQMAKEGWMPEHDDGHNQGELARAAACYAIEDLVIDDDSFFIEWWPWEIEWWKPKDRITNLIRAGALIAAEIDRLQRAALSAAAQESE